MAKSTNTNRQVVSDEAADGILLGFYEARAAQEDHEAAGTWETPAGIAAEAAMGHLRMALEAMGFDMTDRDGLYAAWKRNR